MSRNTGQTEASATPSPEDGQMTPEQLEKQDRDTENAMMITNLCHALRDAADRTPDPRDAAEEWKQDAMDYLMKQANEKSAI